MVSDQNFSFQNVFYFFSNDKKNELLILLSSEMLWYQSDVRIGDVSVKGERVRSPLSEFTLSNFVWNISLSVREIAAICITWQVQVVMLIISVVKEITFFDTKNFLKCYKYLLETNSNCQNIVYIIPSPVIMNFVIIIANLEY